VDWGRVGHAALVGGVTGGVLGGLFRSLGWAGGAARAATAERGAGRATTDFVTNATVKSHGEVIGQGTVDVRSTVQGIKSGTLSPRNVFRNNEGLLPSQPPGYYQEFVHPTPGVSGVGPQRIVAGQGGELFYTPDHYSSFIPLN
jgi:hypothetical protein